MVANTKFPPASSTNAARQSGPLPSAAEKGGVNEVQEALPKPPGDKFAQTAAGQVVRLAPLDGAPLAQAPAGLRLSWQTGPVLSDPAARAARASAEAMRAIEAFATQSAGGKLTLELAVVGNGKGGEKAGL